MLYDFMANSSIYIELFKQQYQLTKIKIKKILTKLKLFV
jgi:hypothetical protein